MSWRPGAGERGRRAQERGQPRRAQQRRQEKKGGRGTGSARGVRQTSWGAWRTQGRERGSEPRGLLHAPRAGRAPFARPGCHGDDGGAQHLRGRVARGRPPARTHAALVGEAESGAGVMGSGASYGCGTERCCCGSAPGRQRASAAGREAEESTSATRRTRSPRCGSRAASKSKSPRQRRVASMSRPTPPATQASNELEPKWLEPKSGDVVARQGTVPNLFGARCRNRKELTLRTKVEAGWELAQPHSCFGKPSLSPTVFSLFSHKRRHLHTQ